MSRDFTKLVLRIFAILMAIGGIVAYLVGGTDGFGTFVDVLIPLSVGLAFLLLAIEYERES